MKRITLALAVGLSMVATAAFATDTAPYISGTGGLTSGNVVTSGGTVGQLTDGGNAPGIETATQLGSGSCTGSITIATNPATGYYYCTSTGTTTWAVSNPATSGKVSSFTLELTNGGSQTQNWMTGTKWPGGSAPTFTTAGVDLIVCSTRDAGTTWRCVLSEKDSK